MLKFLVPRKTGDFHDARKLAGLSPSSEFLKCVKVAEHPLDCFPLQLHLLRKFPSFSDNEKPHHTPCQVSMSPTPSPTAFPALSPAS